MVFEKIYSCLFIPNYRKKLCDYVLIIYMKKYEILLYLCRRKARASSAKIIYSNPTSDIARSVKTTAHDQTIIYNYIFTSLRCKKVQSQAKQFKELFSLVCYFFALN